MQISEITHSQMCNIFISCVYMHRCTTVVTQLLANVFFSEKVMQVSDFIITNLNATLCPAIFNYVSVKLMPTGKQNGDCCNL